MKYQSVCINILDESGFKTLGKLKIRSKFETYFKSNSFTDQGILYSNVKKVTDLDDKTPIQYFINQDEENIPHLVLLEETLYELTFESSYLNSSEKILIFPSITNQREDILDHWDEKEGPYRAYLNFRSYVGKSFFDIEIGSLKSKKYPFEVRSKKIGYYKQYDAMISDLAQVASGMIFEQNAPLMQCFDFGHKKRETFYEEYMFLEYLFQPENLPFAYELILRNPHSKLEKYSEIVPTPFAYNLGPSELIELVSKPENLCKAQKTPNNWPQNMHDHIPETINHNYFEDTLDTPENRLLKYFLESVDKLIYDLLLEKDGNVKDKLPKFHEIIQNYLSDRWLQDIGSLKYIPMNSQVMQKKEGYRDIFKYYIYFEFAFRLKWKDIEDKLEGYEKKLSDLYEYWCYIKLLNILTEISGKQLKFEDVYQVDAKKWSISLRKGRINAQEFNLIHENKPVNVKVIYGGRFSKESYSLPLKPDYTLIITYQGKKRYVHFDAKYKFQKKFLDYINKLKSNNYNELNEDDEEIYREYKSEDIFKMHTYKDAIKKSLGAYILYPGNITKIFEEYTDNKVPSVGAFYLTPGGDNQKEKKIISVFINDLLDLIIDPDNSI